MTGALSILAKYSNSGCFSDMAAFPSLISTF